MVLLEETITSPQNKYVSLARGLTNKKNRENSLSFRFDGVKLLCEAIKRNVEISFVLVSEKELETVLDKAEKLYGIKKNDINCRVMPVAEHIFAKISEEQAPEGVICVANYVKNMHKRVSKGEGIVIGDGENVLMLESVRDPQNVGAIARVAVAFGVDRIVMSSDCADIYNSKTLRASMGAIFACRIDAVEDIPSVIRDVKGCGRRVFAAALNKNAKTLGSFELERGDCVLIGNEGHGLSDAAVDACGSSVFIPMTDGVESLNAATAAAVLVWEFFGSEKACVKKTGN